MSRYSSSAVRSAISRFNSAVSRYNSQVRAHNARVRDAVSKYNSAVRDYNRAARNYNSLRAAMLNTATASVTVVYRLEWEALSYSEQDALRHEARIRGIDLDLRDDDEF